MNQKFDLNSKNPQTSTMGRMPLMDVVEASPTRGELFVPAIKEVSLALTLSDFSASWRGSQGFRSEAISAGTVSICEFDQARYFEMQDSAKLAVVVLRNEILEQARENGRHKLTELEAHDVLQDVTLRRLLKLAVREKRDAFPSGALFLDGVATALASYLVNHYSTASSGARNSAGGMAPAVLRRCIEFIEAHLERDLRLNELAGEAGLSASHFTRSFRESTGKTPYQFLLHRRVERARTLMHDRRVSLTEVALASGFADQHHLARVFRRITSLTPSSYRRSLR
jgi:AraC family transcriptional regulator